jgi:arylsulfatase
MVPTFADQPHGREVLYWEHEGNRAVRKAKWKLVCKKNCEWELHDMEAGRTELSDVASEHPDIVKELSILYHEWAKRCDVMEFDDLRALRQPRFRAKREAERAASAKEKNGGD